jgi:hypothetical protein
MSGTGRLVLGSEKGQYWTLRSEQGQGPGVNTD